MAWATTAQSANEGERAQTDWGTDPELPAYKGSFSGDATRPGWDDLCDDVEEFARRAMQQRSGYIVPGYLNGLRPYISGGQLWIDTGAAVVNGWWCPNLTSAATVLLDNGTSYVYVGVTAGGVPDPGSILTTDYADLSDIAPAVILCEVVQTAGTVTSIKDMRHLAMMARGDDLWPALRMMATQGGAEGIYSGGADDISDFSAGKYPAASMIVFDDHGGAVPARWTQAQAVGKDNLAASGTYKLYAVINFGDNEPQDPAQSGWVPLLIEAYDSGTAAPSNSFLLGAGTYTGTTLSTFTIDASARVKSQFFTDGGGDHVLTVTRADLAADRTYTIPDAGAAADFVMTAGTQTVAGAKTFSGIHVLTNGLVRIVRDAKFGPPTSGTYAVGDLWFDLAGAQWRCTATGPTTWVQMTAGVASTWSGGGASDITTAANWNGGALLTGYRVVDTTTFIEWVYDTTGSLNKWRTTQAKRMTFPFYLSSSVLFTATQASAYTLPMPSNALLVKEWCVLWAPASGSGIDGSNYWTADIIPQATGGASLQTLTKNTNGQSIGRWSPAVSSANNIASTNTRIDLTFTKTGSPPNIYIQTYLETYDLR